MDYAAVCPMTMGKHEIMEVDIRDAKTRGKELRYTEARMCVRCGLFDTFIEEVP